MPLTRETARGCSLDASFDIPASSGTIQVTIPPVIVPQELAKGHHDKVEALLDRAISLSVDIGDPITRVSD